MKAVRSLAVLAAIVALANAVCDLTTLRDNQEAKRIQVQVGQGNILLILPPRTRCPSFHCYWLVVPSGRCQTLVRP